MPGTVPWAVLQILPLAIAVLFTTACSGPTDVGGGSGDFLTSRRSDMYLRSFISSSNANVAISALNSPQITSWNPRFTNNNNAITIIFQDLFAHLVINNGIGVRLDLIDIKFTETTGGDLVDFRVAPPTPVPGQFDFQIRSGISLPASPLTSIGQPLAEPRGTETNHFVPLGLFSTGIFDFQRGQPGDTSRPVTARITFSGRDILDNPIIIVGSINLNPFLTESNSNN